MKLWRSFSGSKPQSGEERIGGGSVGLSPDPLLDARQALGGLVNVVALGDVGEGVEQRVEAFAAGQRRSGRRIFAAAARRPYDRPHPVDLSHPGAFPCGVPAATQSRPVAG